MENYPETTYDITYYYGGFYLMDAHIKEIADKYIADIKSTDEYMAYSGAVSVLERIPELMERVTEYRQENFRLQNRYEGDELFDKLDELQNRYDDILNDGRVSLFLHAESGFCKMMQEVNNYVVEGFDFR